MPKKTQLLEDSPATADEFGPHKKIADLIRDEINGTPEGRSIALVGDWGSGKSTIIELLKLEFPPATTAPVHLFIYDAWAHQGDSLRRAFLDDFITSLKDRLTEDQIESVTGQIWNRAETTTTTTEPVLRRHAKILLLTLALVPLGMKLFSLPDDKELIEGLLEPNNKLASLFLLAPVLATALFGLVNCTGWELGRRFFFGESRSEAGFSVLSFFFERVQGRIERKHVKTPVDSIHAFREVFSEILDNALGRNSDLSVVIVIDNIDRIPPDQAREFWSTMQTFFGDSGGLRKPKTKKYWLVAPFSEEALSFLFWGASLAATDEVAAKKQAREQAKAYVDKTFGLAFYVPPPILTNWRRYLLGKLRYAFPEHDGKEMILVRDVYDFARSSSSITPRDMKLFVNNLVALYRQRGDDIALHILAIYILHRDQIDGNVIADDLLLPVERRQIDEADWKVPIAALHFGVGLDEATQILLEEPMRSALREGASDKLKELEIRPGFADVLRRVAAQELDAVTAENAPTLSQVAATIGALEGASATELSGIWRDIRTRFASVTNWRGLRPETAEGIKVLIAHAPAREKGELCQTIATSLSKAALVEPDGDYQKINPEVQDWLKVVLVVAEEANADQGLRVDIQGGMKLKIELLQQLAELDASDEIKSIFHLEAVAEEINPALVVDILRGSFPRVQVPLVTLLTEKMKADIQWSPIIRACSVRLSEPGVGENEVQALINLLLAAGAIGAFQESFSVLKELSIQGHLSNLLYTYQNSPVRPAVMAAIMLSNAGFERSQQVAQSAAGDAIFNGLLEKPESNPDDINGVAVVIKSVRADSLLFDIGVKNARIAHWVGAVIAELVRSSYVLGITAKTVVEQREFLEAHANLNPIVPFLKSLREKDEILKLLTSEVFQVARLPFYGAALSLASDAVDREYIDYLKRGVLSLKTEEWNQSLNANDDAHAYLLELAADLHEIDGGFELSTPARAAALLQIRNMGRGAPVPSDKLRTQLDKLLKLLPQETQRFLMRDIVDDMVGHSDPDQITRIVEAIGDHITFEDESSSERIGRRIFSPIVGNPTEICAIWMTKVVARRSDFFMRMPNEVKNDLGWKLRAAIQNKETHGQAVTEALITLAGLLEIDIRSPEDGQEEDETAGE